jgi:hypothetical protein
MKKWWKNLPIDFKVPGICGIVLSLIMGWGIVYGPIIQQKQDRAYRATWRTVPITINNIDFANPNYPMAYSPSGRFEIHHATDAGKMLLGHTYLITLSGNPPDAIIGVHGEIK